jgi:hypothetical protein
VTFLAPSPALRRGNWPLDCGPVPDQGSDDGLSVPLPVGKSLVPASEDVSGVSKRIQFRVFGIEFGNEQIDPVHRKGASDRPRAELR